MKMCLNYGVCGNDTALPFGGEKREKSSQFTASPRGYGNVIRSRFKREANVK